MLSNVAPDTFTPAQLSEAYKVGSPESKKTIKRAAKDNLSALKGNTTCIDPLDQGSIKKDPKAFSAMFNSIAEMDKDSLKKHVKKRMSKEDILNNPELLELSEKQGFGKVVANKIKKDTFGIDELDQAVKDITNDLEDVKNSSLSTPEKEALKEGLIDKQAGLVKISMKQFSELLKDPKAKAENMDAHMDSIAKMDPDALAKNNVLGMASEAKASQQVIDTIMNHKHDVMEYGVAVQHMAFDSKQLLEREAIVKEQERRKALGVTGRVSEDLKKHMMGTSKTSKVGVSGVATSGKNKNKTNSKGPGIS